MSAENETESALEIRVNTALAKFLKAQDDGQPLDRDAFIQANSDIAVELEELLSVADSIERMAGPRLADISEDRIDINDRTLPHISSEAASLQPLKSLPSGSTRPQMPCSFGEYVLEKIIGHGGMGIVYQARQTSLERQLAIKMIRSGCLAKDEEVQRFYAEARSVARLDHPNIITVYQCGECDGHHYFSMDLIDGIDLSRRISGGSLPGRDAARYVRDVARAIAYAHSKGIVHRDLKPANVLIDKKDSVVITDFGLAKVMNAESGLTATGAALGTPSYMSPEQAAGKMGAFSESTDIYSLGAILFALLTSKPPFAADSAVNTIMQVIHQPPPRVRQLSPKIHRDLETICDKCLQKQPQRRYQSASELADDLERFLVGEPIRAKPLSKLQKTTYWLAGIPIVAALTGMRGSTAKSHHWAQRILIACLFFVLLATVVGPRIKRWWINNHIPNDIRIAAGVPDGSYFNIAGHIATRMNTVGTGKPMTLATEGSEENLQRLIRNEVHLALVQANALRDQRVAVIAPLYFETVHVMVRKSSGIQDASDLNGRKILIGPEKSGMKQTAVRLLNEIGIGETDTTLVSGEWDFPKITDDIDAVIVVIQAGSIQVNEFLSNSVFELLPLDDAVQYSLDEPTFRVSRIQPTDYPRANLPESITTVATPAFLACRSDASAKMVQHVLKTLYETEPLIEGLISFQSASHWKNPFFHPAATVYFEERESSAR